MAEQQVAGVILAGGLARRMGGGDKGLRTFDGRPLLDHIVARFAPQVGPLVLNANGDPARFADTGLPVAADVVADHPGPLAGVLTGLDWAAAHHPGVPWLVSVPCDAPFIPRDLVARLLAAAEAEGKPLAVAASHGRNHPVVGLWSVALRDDLRRALTEEGLRKVDLWTARHGIAEVAFEDADYKGKPVDPFFNANRPEDLAG